MEPDPAQAIETISTETRPPGVIYVYGICQRPPESLHLPLGLEQQTTLVMAEDLAAVVEPGLSLQEISPEDPRLLTAVLSHDRVICDLFQQMPLLPLRFGTQLAGLEPLQQHLATHAADYRAKLVSLADRAEYQLKLTPHEIALDPLPAELKGREYFLAKKQRLQAQTLAQQQQQADLEVWLDQLHNAHGPWLVTDRQNDEVKVHLLLTPAAAVGMKQQVDLWRSQTPHWHLTLSAALPPYHFV